MCYLDSKKYEKNTAVKLIKTHLQPSYFWEGFFVLKNGFVAAKLSMK